MKAIDWRKLDIHPDNRDLIQEAPWKLDRVLHPETVVDIGAHVGTFSLCAAAYGAKRVAAYEPDPTNFQRLVKNIINYGYWGTVVPVAAALSDRGGKQLLRGTGATGQHSLLYADHLSGQAVQSVQFWSTLNDYREVYGRIDYLKIDVEGEEWKFFTPNRCLPNNINALLLTDTVRFLDMELHCDGLHWSEESRKLDTSRQRLVDFFTQIGFEVDAVDNGPETPIYAHNHRLDP